MKTEMIWNVKRAVLFGRNGERYMYGDPVPPEALHRINATTYASAKKIVSPDEFRRLQEKARPKPKTKPLPKKIKGDGDDKKESTDKK